MHATYNSGINDVCQIGRLVHHAANNIIVSHWRCFRWAMSMLFAYDIQNRLGNMQQNILYASHGAANGYNINCIGH